MDVTPLRAVRVTSQCRGSSELRAVFELTVDENGKQKLRKGRAPRTETVVDLARQPKIKKSKSVMKDSSEKNSHRKVVDLTIDKNISLPQAGTVEAKPEKQDSARQKSLCKVVNLTVDKNVSQPVAETEMLTSERRCSPRHKEVPHTASIFNPTSEINTSPPQGEQSSIGQDSQYEVVKQTVDNNVSQPRSGRVMLTPERRFSPRLKEIPQGKRPFYGSDKKSLSNSPNGKVCSERDEDKSLKRQLGAHECDLFKKRYVKDQSNPSSLPDLDMALKDIEGSKSKMSIGSALPETGSPVFIEFKDNAYLKWTNHDRFVEDSINEMANSKVKETVRTFNKHYLHFVQEEEKRCKKLEEGCSPTDAIIPSKQLDLKALTEMLMKKETSNTEKNFGCIPGIPVGHKFFSRAEMAAIGFRGHWSTGIDYVGKITHTLKRHKGHSVPLAVAIVLSGQYEEDVDGLTEVIYTCQGENDLLGNKRQIKDQAMLRGNLALKNNMEQNIPVRVIRGHECAESFSSKVYTYCGLYKVVKHWDETGVSGVDAFKYSLMPLPGGPKLDSDQDKFGLRQGLNGSSDFTGLICEDMSFGEEALPVPVTNVVDNARIVPPGFKYFNSVQFSSTIPTPRPAKGCKCNGKCSNRNTCSCARLNGSDFPYVQKDGGLLVEPKDVVYECGPLCSCGPSCINRSSQRPLKYRLEVYRTEKKGWAVRSWDFIPSGAPLIEYTGIVRRQNDLDNITENEFIFEIDCWHTMHGLGGRERRQGDHSTSSDLRKVDERTADSESEFCVDGGNCGNVSRFINHSCEPNLFVQCVLSNHHDLRLARIVLFAADDIPPMEELTYDYGYALDSVVGPDGKLKHLTCYCGTSECRGRLY